MATQKTQTNKNCYYTNAAGYNDPTAGKALDRIDRNAPKAKKVVTYRRTWVAPAAKK